MSHLPVFLKSTSNSSVRKLAAPFAVGCAVGGAVCALVLDNIRLRSERRRWRNITLVRHTFEHDGECADERDVCDDCDMCEDDIDGENDDI